ncbi:DUF3885 domain-containing protein [Lentzea cavernae]|uniref:DUF3885 domain-containing protein n=1 Tax=Lentzea cavernae TaxID=2020703 RepID=A0ABQ3MHV2_9PSEU|nr:hypothetical protein [Lentzea cavernae]GHH42954.1 hypothetical protein GCM10017774_40150 [Lentzea cavernae]
MPDEELLRRWEERWPDCPPIGHDLRCERDRWVRFHSLPESKRYPDTEDEWAIVLDRYNTVLDELFAGVDVHVVTSDWSRTPAPPERPHEQTVWHPGAHHWTSVLEDPDPDFQIYTHVYVSRIPWERGCIDTLLRAVANDATSGVLIIDADLQRAYHPYDGGADVILTTSAERDELCSRHADWLSTHPSGL